MLNLESLPPRPRRLRFLVPRLRIGGLVHAGGLDLGPAREALQAPDLLAQDGGLGAQRSDLLQQLENQPLEVLRPKSLNIW
jgi:hypothetical protein